MSGPPISRRSFLAGSAAAAATLASGAGIPAAEAAAALSVPAALAPVLPKGGSWGYSLCGDEWHTGFSSMADAIDQSLCEDLEWGSVEVAYCVPDPILYPRSPQEAVARWLAEPYGSLGHLLRDRFRRANEEIDWEGNFDDAVGAADPSPMTRPAATAVAEALLRLGRDDAAAAVLSHEPVGPADRPPIEADAAARDAVSLDGRLGSELTSVLESWVATTAIPKAGRTVSTRMLATVAVEYDEEADEYRVAATEPEIQAAALAA